MQLPDFQTQKFNEIGVIVRRLQSGFSCDVAASLLDEVDAVRESIFAGEKLADLIPDLLSAGLFQGLKTILEHRVDQDIQKRILHTFDFCLHSMPNVGPVLGDGLVEALLASEFDVRTLDIILCFAGVLKAISQHLDDITSGAAVLLYGRGLKLVGHSDSSVCAAARFVVLSVARCSRPDVLDQLGRPEFLPAFGIFLDGRIGADEMCFVSDCLEAGPQAIRLFLLDRLRPRLARWQAQELLMVVQYIESPHARSILQRALCDRVWSLPADFELLVRVVERRLLLWDAAARLGLVKARPARFDGAGVKEPTKVGFELIPSLLREAKIATDIRMALRLATHLKLHPPEAVDCLRRAVGHLRELPTRVVVAALLRYAEMPRPPLVGLLDVLEQIVIVCDFLRPGSVNLKMAPQPSDIEELPGVGLNRVAVVEAQGKTVTVLVLPERAGHMGRKLEEKSVHFFTNAAVEWAEQLERRQRPILEEVFVRCLAVADAVAT